MPVLTFFVARVLAEAGRKKSFLFLRHQYSQADSDFSASEASLTAFCFPLGPEAVIAKEFMASEEYTFTLTGGNGQRYQGFCRKFLPPKPAVGSKLQLPMTMCVMSEDPWAQFYFKVLQVLEQLLKSEKELLSSDLKELPPDSHAAQFLQTLGQQLALGPRPSEVLRVALPRPLDLMGVSPHRLLASGHLLAEDCLELQAPIDCGNGRWNCGVSLARLLWDVPVPALTTLMASMLLERRIILVSAQRDTVTAAVQAASALLYPFKWHHIYLPMLPQAFKDYLSAPMPFMVGLQSQMLHTLSAIPMDEITVIDLDIRSCKPIPGSVQDDARGLPWRDQLEAALSAAHKLMRSPNEHETSPLIASIMQEFFIKLLGNYRRFIHPDTPALNAKWAAQVASGTGSTPQQSPRLRRASSSGRFPSGPGADSERSGHGGAGASQRGAPDNVMKAAGFVFEHTAFVRSHRRNDKARTFLSHLRGSQLYAMFVQERLEAAAVEAQGVVDSPLLEDPFEMRVTRYQERRRLRFDKLRTVKGGSVLAQKWNNLIRKHRRTDSEDSSMMNGLDLGGSSSSSGQGAGTGLGAHIGGLAASMRRIITYPSAMAGHQQAQGLDSIDPTSFFPEDDDDDYEDLWELSSPSTSLSGAATTGRPDAPNGRIMSAVVLSSAHLKPDRAAASFAAPGPTGAPHTHAATASHRLASASSPTAPTHSSSGSGGPSQTYGMGYNADVRDRQPSTSGQEGFRGLEGSFGNLMKEMKSAVTDAASTVARKVTSGTAAATSSIAAAASSLAASSSGYKHQLTGDGGGVQRSGLSLGKQLPQGSGNVLDTTNGKLRPPPSSARPLLGSLQQPSSSAGEVLNTTTFVSRPGSSSGGAAQQPAVASSGAGNKVGVSIGLYGGPGYAGHSNLGVSTKPAVDTAPLIEGFDGFAQLASSHSPGATPTAGHGTGAASVSLLDL